MAGRLAVVFRLLHAQFGGPGGGAVVVLPAVAADDAPRRAGQGRRRGRRSRQPGKLSTAETTTIFAAKVSLQ